MLEKRRHFEDNSGYCTQENTFGEIFKQRKPLQKTRSKGVWAYKRVHRPMVKSGLGGKMVRVAFQSKPTLGLVFHP